MRKSIFICSLATTLAFYSCGNRQTDTDEIRLEEKAEKISPDEMDQTGLSVSSQDPDELAAINSAKNQVNKYFEALNNGDDLKAYEEMATSSDRGTRSSFSEKNANIESVELSFTEDGKVSMQGDNTEIKLPIRYVVKTKQGNTESYNGYATISKKGDDGDFKIQEMNVTRENQ